MAGFSLGDALKTLENAKGSFSQIATDRQNTLFRPVTDDLSQRIINDFNTSQKEKILKYEGDVAMANIAAIDALVSQLRSWRNCSPAPAELIRFIDNKVKLERASQIAEIAWMRIASPRGQR